MKMLRLLVIAFVVVCCGVSVFAQNPPQITNTSFDFDTIENSRPSMILTVSDPDPGETLTITFSLNNPAVAGITEAQLQLAFKSKAFNFSSGTVANQFSVPAGTLNKTIEIRVDVTGNDTLTDTEIFRYHVVGINQPPVLSLTVDGPGVNTTGTESNPFRYGSIQLHLTVNDDRGVGQILYEARLLAGSFCMPEFSAFRWFGREGFDPTVDVAPVATVMRILLTVTVTDGTHQETVNKTVWIEPELEGCNIGGTGGGPLDSVTATASPNPVSTDGFISLIGSMTGDTTPYSAAWYLESSTSGEVLIANGWTAQYQAPNFSTTLNFKFKVKEISGINETVKTVPVIVSSSGGGGGGTTPPPQPPPDPICGCVGAGDPPDVTARADSTTVVAGETLGLSGYALDPNWPIGTAGAAPNLLWKIENNGGIAGLSLVNADQSKAQLRTPAAIDTEPWILLKLEAKNVSNQCVCWDYLQVQVVSEAVTPTGGSGAGLQYAWAGESFQPATGATVARDVTVPFQLQLKSVPAGFTSPTFKWQTNRSDGTFSPSDTSQDLTLMVTGQSGESAISLSVVLTVTESGDPSVSEQATANFQLIVTGSSAAPENVDFVMSEQSAEPGTLVTLEGYAESAGGASVQDMDFFWTVVTGDGDPVDVLTSHNRAIFEVPTSTETSSSVDVTLVAGENGVPSLPVSKGLQIASPTLRFAHFGAGPTGGQILEVQLILVNDTEEAVEDSGRLWFVRQDGTPNSVMVDDELVEEGVWPFSVDPESSKMFKIVTPDEDLRVGWMAVSSPVPLEGIILFQYVDADSGDLLTETALFASETGRRVSTAVNGRAGAIGFAIANPSAETPVEVIVAIPIDGAALEVPITLQPLEQKAQFLSQLHELVDGNMSVSGTLVLEVQSSEGNVVTTVLRLTKAGLSTLPVAVRKE